MLRLKAEVEEVETTKPGDEYRSYRPGMCRLFLWVHAVWLELRHPALEKLFNVGQ